MDVIRKTICRISETEWSQLSGELRGLIENGLYCVTHQDYPLVNNSSDREFWDTVYDFIFNDELVEIKIEK